MEISPRGATSALHQQRSARSWNGHNGLPVERKSVGGRDDRGARSQREYAQPVVHDSLTGLCANTRPAAVERSQPALRSAVRPSASDRVAAPARSGTTDDPWSTANGSGPVRRCRAVSSRDSARAATTTADWITCSWYPAPLVVS